MASGAMSSAARALGTTSGLCALLLLASPAAAQTLDARFDLAGELIVSTSLDGFADPTTLEDGLRHVVELGLEVRSTSLPSTVLRRERRRCAVTYSGWTREFTIDVTIETTIPVGTPTVSSRIDRADAARVRSTCRDLVETSLGPIPGSEPVDVTLLPTLDAPSADAIHRLRRWVVNPHATDAWIPSYLGLVVQVFVNRLVLLPADDRPPLTTRASR